MSERSTKTIISRLLGEDGEDFVDFKDLLSDLSPRKGYFVLFSRPLPFGSPNGGTVMLDRIGPYSNTHEAARKLRFSLIDEEGVTGRVVQQAITRQNAGEWLTRKEWEQLPE